MFSTSSAHNRPVRVVNLAMVVSFCFAIVAYLPFGLSGGPTTTLDGVVLEDKSFIQILWFSIPSSANVNEMLTYLIPIIGPIAVATVLLCLIISIRLISPNERIMGRYGLALMVAGLGSLYLFGLLRVLHTPNTMSSFDSYAIIAQVTGIALFASGVLGPLKNVGVVTKFHKMIGTDIVGSGALFLLVFAGAIIIDSIFTMQDMVVWTFLNSLWIVGIPLVLIGIVWIENGILTALKKKALVLRMTMAASLSILLIGSAYLFLQNGPFVGIRVGGPLEWGTMATFLSYLFTLGILLVLGTTILMSMKMGKVTERIQTING